MKHIYLSTDDIGDGLSVLDGKVKVSDNYLTEAQSDSKYQASGAYATSEQLSTLDTKVDSLVDVYQPLGNYITVEDADLKYLTNESLVDYATKEYVDQAIAGIGSTGGGFDGTYVGDSIFTGGMVINGELTVDSLYDKTGTRQILLSDIVTMSDLNGLLPENPNNFILPVADATTLGGVKIGENIKVSQDGTISVSFPVVDDVVIPIATISSVGVVKIGENLTIDQDGTVSGQPGFNGTYSGDSTFNGNLTVNGNITYTGELISPIPPEVYSDINALYDEIAALRQEVLELRERDVPQAMQSQPKSPNPQAKPMTVFKRRT
ncbi:MAG: hypothetical protein ACRDD8_05465 [Bacteroidales bacterium]